MATATATARRSILAARVFTIEDDGPVATADIGNVNEGALLAVAASGVLSNDVAGADGFAPSGGVVEGLARRATT